MTAVSSGPDVGLDPSKEPPALTTGAVFLVRYPFVREEVDLPPDDPEANGPTTVMTWRPGTVAHPVYPDDAEEVAHGEGFMELTIVSVFRPGRFPARVFFTRRWIDPDGRAFGKGALRITTAQAFKRRAAAFGYEYEMDPGHGLVATTSPNEKKG